MTSAIARLAAAAVALVAGGIAGISAVALHGYGWGLALGAVAAAVTIVALPPTAWGRLPFATAWLLIVVTAANRQSEGDYLIAADVPGYGCLAVAALTFGYALFSTIFARHFDSPDEPA